MRVIATLLGVAAAIVLCIVVAVHRGSRPAFAGEPTSVAPATPASLPPPPVAAPWLTVVVPASEVLVTAPAKGRVAEVSVRLGDSVEAGQVVARIDPERARQELAEERARLSVRDAERREAIAKRARQRDRLDRIEKIATIVAETERVDARLALAEANADVERTTAEIRAQKLVIAQIDATLRDTTIRAPLAGEVSARLVDAGAAVEAGAPIVRIVELGRRFRFAIAPDDVAPELGEPVQVRCGDTTRDATVRQVAPHVDPATRLVLVEAEPIDATGLRIGDTCEATGEPRDR